MVLGTDTDRMIARWLTGESVRSIAKDFGISGQAVHKRILRVATPAQQRRARVAWFERRHRARLEREAAEQAAAIHAAREAGRTCPICGALLLREWQVTCGGRCAEDFTAARHRLDGEANQRRRMSRARYILRHPERHRASEVRWARRMLSATPPPPNRSFTRAGSRASEVEREVRGEAA